MSAACSEPPLLFVTPRLGVRRYCQTDRCAHDRLRGDPAVRRFMHWPDAETFATVLADAANRTPPDELGWINLAVVARGSGDLTGDHGLIIRDRVPCIGLALLPELRRQGLGRELVKASCNWLAANGYARVQAEIDYGNAASFAFFAALGFTVIDDRTDDVGPYAVLERAITAVS